MATPSISVDAARFVDETNRLLLLQRGLGALAIGHRKLICEVVLVRLFLLVENTVRSVCAKLLCNTAYIDGTVPQRLVRAGTVGAAIELIKKHGRNRPKENMGWSSTNELNENMMYTLQAIDPYFQVIRNYGAYLADMRYVRNHVVHRNEQTRKHYRKVVRNRYGAYKRGVSPGTLLLTTTANNISQLEEYIRKGRVFINDLTRA